MLFDELLDPSLFTCLEPSRVREMRLWCEPPFCRAIPFFDVDVRWLIVLKAEEVELESLDVLDGPWAHGAQTYSLTMVSTFSTTSSTLGLLK